MNIFDKLTRSEIIEKEMYITYVGENEVKTLTITEPSIYCKNWQFFFQSHRKLHNDEFEFKEKFGELFETKESLLNEAPKILLKLMPEIFTSHEKMKIAKQKKQNEK